MVLCCTHVAIDYCAGIVLSAQQCPLNVGRTLQVTHFFIWRCLTFYGSQASTLDPQCFLCLRERLNLPTYSVVDSDALDEGRNWNGVGLESGGVSCRRDLSGGVWDPKFFPVMRLSDFMMNAFVNSLLMYIVISFQRTGIFFFCICTANNHGWWHSKMLQPKMYSE